MVWCGVVWCVRLASALVGCISSPSWSSNHGGAFVLKIGGFTITSIIQNKKPVSELFSLVCRSRPKTKSRSSSKTPLAALSHHDRRALPRALPSLTRRLPRHPDCPHSARNAPLAAALMSHRATSVQFLHYAASHHLPPNESPRRQAPRAAFVTPVAVAFVCSCTHLLPATIRRRRRSISPASVERNDPPLLLQRPCLSTLANRALPLTEFPG